MSDGRLDAVTGDDDVGLGGLPRSELQSDARLVRLVAGAAMIEVRDVFGDASNELVKEVGARAGYRRVSSAEGGAASEGTDR